jgi:hypothetical protein
VRDLMDYDNSSAGARGGAWTAGVDRCHGSCRRLALVDVDTRGRTASGAMISMAVARSS